MTTPERILVIQTAFIGDVILTLPLIQALRAALPRSRIAVVTTPRTAGVLENHPAIDEVIPFDKGGAERGIPALLRRARMLGSMGFQVALVPSRTLRSALLARLAGIPERVGFDQSPGRMLFTRIIPYRRTDHEIDRDLALAVPLGVSPQHPLPPQVHPSAHDAARVDTVLREHCGGRAGFDPQRMIALGPGSVWNTKRWPEERYAELAGLLAADGWSVVLVGGEADAPLCARIAERLAPHPVLNAAGRLSLLQSAELIRRCRVAVSNDSAPMHLAVSVGTPVVAIYGATVPAFGFAPRGPHDRVVEINGLECRPCGIHGGVKCPITTFDCMVRISSADVRSTILQVLHGAHTQR